MNLLFVVDIRDIWSKNILLIFLNTGDFTFYMDRNHMEIHKQNASAKSIHADKKEFA